MKVFFVASIHGKDKLKGNYEAIIRTLKKAGYVVYSDHVMNYSKSELSSWDSDKRDKFHRKILKGIKSSDVVVSEISFPSVSVGYLISRALDFGKPTIVLYSEGNLPHILDMLEEVNKDKLQAIKYNQNDLEKKLLLAMNVASESMDTRFNFFISPEIGAYLDWISKNKRIPRAVYLRRLIEEDMKNNKEYNGEE